MKVLITGGSGQLASQLIISKPKSTKIIKEFLKIKCDLKSAHKILNNFFKKHTLTIIVGKDYFPIKVKKNK